ncbi:glycerophosphodiester phosphodiesterase GDPD1, chloroplastic isoform X2 [Andrographis paniculata]|uniref:glycerophosphodiester phosphodiesterase GDPD1, chloroplastic isoform X2 n=1 Tax=Andrographis paniculata TaxID=175694 RepID=UPI0021E916DC|nr:glycerophosphodiester phosphodiesterase GDPD1, chloroplastic isoform X2 [Andrographis paniculata]
MALKAVHVSDVPTLDHVPDNNALYASRFTTRVELGRGASLKDHNNKKFLVIGHRGNGMNMLQSSDLRMKAVKENTILSFNTASQYPIDFIEFDVQVTSDGCPIIFHDNFIYTEEKVGRTIISGKRVTELSLSEFLCYGPQREDGREGKALWRKMKDGKVVNWAVERDDCACTLQEAFERVNPALGFNIELKFDDHLVYTQDYLTHVLEAVLEIVLKHAKERPVIFSSFQPDAALLVRKLQSTYPVYFLTNGGNEVYEDGRRNSLDEAIKVCLEGGLQGIVSEVRGIFRSPGMVNKIKEAGISLLTYGKLNNVAEAVYIQHLMGINGVIVDLVKEISDAVRKMVTDEEEEEEEEEQVIEILSSSSSSLEGEGEGEGDDDDDGQPKKKQQQLQRPQFSQRELSFLLKLIPELLQ